MLPLFRAVVKFCSTNRLFEESSVLWKHSKDKHNGRIPQFCMSVTGKFKNDAMLRFRGSDDKQRRRGKRHEQQKRM